MPAARYFRHEGEPAKLRAFNHDKVLKGDCLSETCELDASNMSQWEDPVSADNVRINTQRLDSTLEQKQKHGLLRRCKSVIRVPYSFIRHALRVKENGWEKTKLLLAADMNKSLIQDYEELCGFDHDYELNYRFIHSERPKIAVYTSIFGDYDSLKEPLYVGDSCDFYAITNMEISKESKWIRKDVGADFFDELDDYHKSKWCKMHPHVLFPEYDYSIWIDGNAQVVADLAPLVDRLTDKCSMATFQNPVHDCIYTESNFCIYHDAVDMNEISSQVRRYRNEGFPNHFGMREFSIIVRRHHDPLLVSLMDEWWSEVNAETMRDQISFPYILWKNGQTIDYIQLLGGNWRENPRFVYAPHKWRHVFKR